MFTDRSADSLESLDQSSSIVTSTRTRLLGLAFVAVMSLGLSLPSRSHAQGLLSTQPQPPPPGKRPVTSPQPARPLQGTTPNNQARIIKQESSLQNPLSVANDLVQFGSVKEGLLVLDKAVNESPNNREYRNARASVRTLAGLRSLAKADYDELIVTDPKDHRAWHQRAWLQLTMGQPKLAVADFDKALELVPSQKPYAWQRGIALYYAGMFEEGRRQFELHQTVNHQDVENAVWHFLCTTKTHGIETARKNLIDITQDSRLPLQQIQSLFAGKISVDDVLNAMKQAPKNRSKEAMFYGHLYLALYFEAINDQTQGEVHIRKCTQDHFLSGLMGDIAQLHRAMRFPASIASPQSPPQRPE